MATTLDPSGSARRSRGLESLAGLSVGDALGERLFVSDAYRLTDVIRDRHVPIAPWTWTDGTDMATVAAIPPAWRAAREPLTAADGAAWAA